MGFDYRKTLAIEVDRPLGYTLYGYRCLLRKGQANENEDMPERRTLSFVKR